MVCIGSLSLAGEEVIVWIGSYLLKVVEGHYLEVSTARHLIETHGLFPLLLKEVLRAALQCGF